MGWDDWLLRAQRLHLKAARSRKRVAPSDRAARPAWKNPVHISDVGASERQDEFWICEWVPDDEASVPKVDKHDSAALAAGGLFSLVGYSGCEVSMSKEVPLAPTAKAMCHFVHVDGDFGGGAESALIYYKMNPELATEYWYLSRPVRAG